LTTNHEAIAWAADAETLGLPVFILWPGAADALDLSNEWVNLDSPLGSSARTLYYFTP
ncbi:MAG: hypothetical protein JJE47_16535, partial [Acidimicrobiia bacterium]|nr:hypothetical protein [Acidimicrobiia bacterium]